MVFRLQALLLLLSFSLFAEEIAGRVVRVVDGDTLTVIVQSVGSRVPRDHSVQHKIRLRGIDAPEKKQPFGRVAGRYLSSLVADREVRVAYTKRDRYGRILGTVYLDGRDINLEMLKAGYAWHYKRFDSTPAYAQAEAAARAARRGLWQDKDPTEPELFRRRGREAARPLPRHTTLHERRTPLSRSAASARWHGCLRVASSRRCTGF